MLGGEGGACDWRCVGASTVFYDAWRRRGFFVHVGARVRVERVTGGVR